MAPAPAPDQAKAAPPAAIAAKPLPAYLDPKNPISTDRSVFFDFDSAQVKSTYDRLIERQGRYLAQNPDLHVRIEGNADERGSAEYNLALGQRRADAVEKALEIYGVREAQLQVVSWGEEKPRASAHDEAAWSLNRRADVVYPSH